MSERPPDPRRLDLRRFARDGGSLRGSLPQALFERLRASLLPPLVDAPAEPVQWSADGQHRPVKVGEPEVWLHLQASTAVRLECQRCLQPLTEAVAIDRHFRFVAGEDEAARMDEESEHDVLALVTRLDLFELLEDELILALPLVPRHEMCTQPLAAGGARAAPDKEPPPHPFAALAGLRRKPPDG